MSSPEPPLEPLATYCYRHPDREAYVRCARCERVICPDCMTEASVGFQCPECVAEGRASVRQPSGVFGGRLTSSTPVTIGLVGICVVIFALEWAAGVNSVLYDYGMSPVFIALDGQWWRLGTAMFLHLTLLHLLFNMYVLWLLGPQLEQAFGHIRFLVLYLLAGLGGSVASYVFSDPGTFSGGASGAIFGIMGALVVAGYKLKADIRQVLILIAINLALGFVIGGIDWRAHIGGLLTGALVAAVLAYAPRNGRIYYQVVGCGLILVLLVIATQARTEQLQALAQQVGLI